MDELAMVRELRADTPPMPAEVEDDVRRRLLAAFASADAPASARGARRFGRATAVRAGLAGALAATVAGAVLVHLTDGRTARPEAGARPPAPEDFRLASAVELGNRAAGAVERLPYTPPRPDQWVYTRTVTAGGFDMNTWWKGVDVTKRESTELWRQVDGRGFATYSRGGLDVRDLHDKPGSRVRHFGPHLLFHLGNYDTLPTDPDTLLRRLYAARYPEQNEPNDAESVFSTMEHILQDPSPPLLRAAVYRALPKLQGVTLRHGTRDAAGRPGVTFTLVDRLGERHDIILDPVTYRYLGWRKEVVRLRTEKLEHGTVTLQPGTVLGWYAIVDQKIVNRPGRRS